MRTIVEEQAEVVRQIFDMYAGGLSPRKIAEELNARGVPSPGSTWKRSDRRTDGRWLASAIYGDPTRGSGILNNALYTGRVEWNRRKSRKQVRSGRRAFDARPEDDWVVMQNESLRIVTQEQWDRVRRRISARSKLIGERVRQGLSFHKAIATGRGPKYVLSGLLRCSLCDSKLVVSGSGQAYACASRLNGGESACPNSLRVSRAKAEERLLKSIRDDLLSDEAVALYRRHLKAAIGAESKTLDRDRKTRDERRRKLEAKVRELVDAIGQGKLRRSPALADELMKAETELASIQSVAKPPIKPPEQALFQAVAEYRRQVSDLGPASGGRIGEVREALAELLGDRIAVGPDAQGRPVAVLEAGIQAMVAGAGFEPATFGL